MRMEWNETKQNRELYTECVRYGVIEDDLEYKTENGNYFREITFTLNSVCFYFKLKNGNIILFWKRG